MSVTVRASTGTPHREIVFAGPRRSGKTTAMVRIAAAALTHGSDVRIMVPSTQERSRVRGLLYERLAAVQAATRPLPRVDRVVVGPHATRGLSRSAVVFVEAR